MKSSLIPRVREESSDPASLRERLKGPDLVVVPVIFDAMSARVAFEAGFDVLSIGSLAVSASKYAIPDTGFMTLNDLSEHVRNVRAAVPESLIIADGEAGFGNAVHVVRAVKTLEAAGANAVHIEDQIFGKHVTDRPWMETAEVTAEKIAAAVSARSSEEFVVIARTDTEWAKPRDPKGAYGPEEAIRRSNLYVEAGADMILLPATPYENLHRMAAEIKAPLMTANLMLPPEATWTEVEAKGLRVLLYFDIGINSAITGMRRALNGLVASRSISGAQDYLMPSAEIDQLMGSNELREVAVRFNVFPH